MSTENRPGDEATPEPTGMTLGDLVALVAGAGLAAGLTWYSQWQSERTLARQPAPAWYIVLLYAREITRKGCLALVPVILVRKIRLGGPIRPGEFAALCVGMDLLLLAAYQWPALGILALKPGTKDVYTVNMGPFWIWYGTQLVLSALAVVLLIVRRRQFPGWAAGLLLCAGWYGLAAPFQVFYKEGFDLLVGDGLMRLPIVTRFAIHALLTSLPFGVLWNLPTAFAALDGLRPRAGRTWVERAGLAAALGLWIVVDCQNFIRIQSNNPALRSPAMDTLHVATPLVVIALSFAMAWLLEPKFLRWLGIDDERRP
jgi:hypothetical protein